MWNWNGARKLLSLDLREVEIIAISFLKNRRNFIFSFFSSSRHGRSKHALFVATSDERNNKGQEKKNIKEIDWSSWSVCRRGCYRWQGWRKRERQRKGKSSTVSLLEERTRHHNSHNVLGHNILKSRIDSVRLDFFPSGEGKDHMT